MPQPKATLLPDADTLLLLGQLLAATKSSAEDIKQLGSNATVNAAMLVSAAKTLEIVEAAVGDLTRIVRTGNGAPSLVAEAARSGERLDRIELVCNSTSVRLQAMENSMAASNTSKTTMKESALYVMTGIAWILTTAVAIYAALKDK